MIVALVICEKELFNFPPVASIINVSKSQICAIISHVLDAKLPQYQKCHCLHCSVGDSPAAS